MLGSISRRRYSAHRSMRTDLVATLAPLSDDGLGLSERFEPVFVETFISELSVEAFDVCILGGLYWLDQNVFDALGLCPGHERSAYEL